MHFIHPMVFIFSILLTLRVRFEGNFFPYFAGLFGLNYALNHGLNHSGLNRLVFLKKPLAYTSDGFLSKLKPKT